MKNIIRFIGLIFIGGLLVWICDLFNTFSGFSQTKTNSKTSVLTNVSVISNVAETPKSSTLSSGTETAVGIETPRKPERESLCSSGYIVIPAELQEIYLNQNKQIKGSDNLSKEIYPLRNEINFYGFTYPFSNIPDLKRDEAQCTNRTLKPEEIRFVKPEVNKILKKYISAVIYNETEINRSKRGISENPNITNKIELCVDIECGTENPNGEKKSFEISEDDYLVSARAFTDTIISINALNNIRSISQSDDLQYLTDSEINQMITVARNIALREVKEDNK